MAAGIVYLDVDDEITSAAQRIRSSSATRVGLVVPYGSRIATSRMNFRLLSREAVVSNRRLSIVSGDAATRALAASAGLPVFGSVPEYEDANEAGRESQPTASADGAASAGAAEIPAAGPAAVAEIPAAGAAGVAATLADSATVAAVGPPSEAPPADATDVPSDETTRIAVPPKATRTRPRPRPQPEPRPEPRIVDRAIERDETELEDRPRRVIRAPILAAAAVAALAVVVLGVGAYLFLPAATIAVTPRREPITIQLTVSADPDATAVDAAAGVVPAVRLEVPVEASETFTTTGVHVEETAAKGSVTFTNYDTGGGVSIPSGSIVSTESGVRFRTQATVALQPAAVFPAFEPSSRSVQVVATKAGEAGNVPANSIRIVPPGKDPVLLRVNNPAETTGGAHTETPEVTKAEVDKAVATLRTKLQAGFEQAIAAGAGAPPDTTLFPGTATPGTPTPSVDPQTLIGQAVPTFDLALSAKGSVIAVDPRPVRTIAETQLNGRIGADHRLVAGSVDVEVGEGSVGEDGQVTFQATARAVRVLVIDANQLRSLVKGKTRGEAEAALARYGDVSVELWPDWVSTVTGMDARLSVTVDDGGTTTGGGGSPSPAASSRPSPSRAGGSPSQASVAP